MSSLKNQAIEGTKWSSLQTGANQLIAFFISLVLARLLTPEDYGTVGVLGVFIAVSNIFVGSGLSLSLIRDKESTNVDYSTVFYYNIAVAVLCYIILYFAAPAISVFFHNPILTNILRVIALNIIICSFGAIQNIILSKNLNFKAYTKISVGVQLITGIIGIILAYTGFGVWTLVITGLLSSLLTTVLLWFKVSWHPDFCFSKTSFQKHFHFGSKLLISSLFDTFYKNIYQLVIGKKFSAIDLGYYTRANNFASLPMNSVLDVIGKVAFPLLSKIQDDDERLATAYRKIIRMVNFFVTPIMLGIISIAHPMVSVLITDKWLPCVPYLQVLCLVCLLYPIHALNLNLLQVKGKSNLFLKLEVIKKILGFGILCITVPFGILAMCLGSFAASLICLFINTYYTKKLIGFGLYEQIRDLIPVFALGIFMMTGSFLCQNLVESSIAKLIMGCTVGSVIYITGSVFGKFQEWRESISIFKQQLYGCSKAR